MTELTPEQMAGQERLRDVARHYAAQHGLRPEAVDWVEQYDGWWLTVIDAKHTVRVVFSMDEIEDFAAEGDGTKGSKLKIRNAFASLTM